MSITTDRNRSQPFTGSTRSRMMNVASGLDIDHTHDPGLRSWVESAIPGQSPFPIQNLPFGVFTRDGGDAEPRIGIRIGDCILDLRAVEPGRLRFPPSVREALAAPTLNRVMALPPAERRLIRAEVSALLRADGGGEAERRAAADGALVVVGQARMGLPAAIGSFVDFYACLNHAVNAGTVLRRGAPAPLLPTWPWMPLAYQGRASSVIVGGTALRRPCGQSRPDRSAPPLFGPTRELDYEAELGAFVGPGCPAGQRVAIDDAGAHIAGFVLVNDWSARDFQTWEGGPLGPLQSKSFATSISPWVVTSEALAPFRAPAFPRAAEDPAPLPYLASEADRRSGGLDIVVEAHLRTARMRRENRPAYRVSRANARELYWTMPQMLTHLASNGSGLSPGDLLASGTLSGIEDGTRGCLLETTQRGRVPLVLDGETRGFLEDGDELVLTATCERDGFVPIGFGPCAGIVTPAVPLAAGRR